MWIKMHRHQLDDVMDNLRQTMRSDGFVHIDGATFRELLVWQGADPSDLNAIEMGKIHAATEQDKEPTMAFRQIAFHRMVSLQAMRLFCFAVCACSCCLRVLVWRPWGGQHATHCDGIG